LLNDVRAALERARAAVRATASEEFVLADLKDAIMSFDQVCGVRVPDDVLHAIFSRFCIGK
jgi:tRNA modification GTPase